MTAIFKLTGALLVTASTIAVAQAETIRFWTTEDQPARLERQEAMAAQFEEMTGNAVEVIPVPEVDMGTRATAAFAAGDLPDVIYLPQPLALPWAEAGILDAETNDEIVEELGRDTFRSGAIEMADFEGLTGRRLDADDRLPRRSDRGSRP